MWRTYIWDRNFLSLKRTFLLEAQMDNHDGAEKWKRRKRVFLCISFSWWQKITTGCAAVYSCGGWGYFFGFFFVMFGVLTSDGTWMNCNCWPCTVLYLLGSQIFNLAPGVGHLCKVFVITEYYLSWKKLSPKMECSCLIKELSEFVKELGDVLCKLGCEL